MTDAPGEVSRGRRVNANAPLIPEPEGAHQAPVQGRAATVNRRIAIVVAILGLIGVLVPLSRAAVDALAVARADLGTFTIDDVADFLTSAGGEDNGAP